MVFSSAYVQPKSRRAAMPNGLPVTCALEAGEGSAPMERGKAVRNKDIKDDFIPVFALARQRREFILFERPV